MWMESSSEKCGGTRKSGFVTEVFVCRLIITWSTCWRHKTYRTCRRGYQPSSRACAQNLSRQMYHLCKYPRPCHLPRMRVLILDQHQVSRSKLASAIVPKNTMSTECSPGSTLNRKACWPSSPKKGKFSEVKTPLGKFKWKSATVLCFPKSVFSRAFSF